MKKLLLTQILFFSSFFVFSQTDSTTIYFKYIEDKNLINICDLAEIQIENIFCEDTLLRGKVFNVIIREFKKGKINSEKDLNITAEKQRVPFVMNGDTIIYELDFTDKTGFGNSTQSLTLTFSGIFKKNEFKLKIGYPGLSVIHKLKGEDNYSLRPAYPSFDNKMKIPVNKAYPILAYTPPFDTGSEIQSYCMLGKENVLDWYDKFKVKHYYVIYLEIK